MLIFASFIVWCAFVLVESNQNHDFTMGVLWYGLAYLAVFAAAHLAIRRWAPYADPLILPCVALLNGMGLVMIYRIDLAMADRAGQAGTTFSPEAPKQIIWTVVALALFLAVLGLVKDHRTVARYGYIAGLVGIVAVALPAVLPSSISEVNGAKVWIKLGSLSIQPGEFAKILLIVFFAAFLVSKRDLFRVVGRRVLGVELPRARDLGPIVIASVGCMAVLAFEKELGAALLFFGIILVMVYVATERAIWVAVGVAMFAAGCVIAYNLFNHVQQRVSNWIDPLATYDKPGGGYQMAQGLFGLGTGGVGGTGLGAGRPDMVPEASTDFITAALGEELGFIGLAAILMVYLVLAMRGMRSALAVRDTFGKILAGGLSFAVIMQIFVVVGGVTKLIPETGITAPFLSKGGSSLLANYVLVALLIRISDAARRPATPSRPQPDPTPLADAHTVLVNRPDGLGKADGTVGFAGRNGYSGPAVGASPRTRPPAGPG